MTHEEREELATKITEGIKELTNPDWREIYYQVYAALLLWEEKNGKILSTTD